MKPTDYVLEGPRPPLVTGQTDLHDNAVSADACR